MDRENNRRVTVELQQLMRLIEEGNIEQLREALGEPLLEKWKLPAYQNIPTIDRGDTLLSWAIRMKSPEALDLLMTNLGMEFLPETPEVDIEFEEKADLLFTALEFYDEPTWKTVIQHIDAEKAFRHLGPTGDSVLHAAARRNITGIFRTLYTQAGTTLKEKLFLQDSHGQTALHVAISQGFLTTVLELLEIQPKLIAEQDHNGETVWHTAVKLNEKQILENLIKVDANSLRKCDNKNNSAYRTFTEFTIKFKHVRNNSSPNKELLRHVPQTVPFDPEIGSMLDKAILNLDLTISEKRKLLFKEGYELLWDLSTFDREDFDFSEYLRFLGKEHLNVKFHETLLRVTIPNLGCTDTKRCDADAHGLRKAREANVIFKHLAVNGVKHILKVVVPDCTIHPHANKDIIDALRPFTIRNLDWRKSNLGVKTIMMSAPDVETLALYSSGDEDALAQWINSDGLCQLPKLQTICITIFRGESNDDDLKKIRLRCEQALLGHKVHSQHNREFCMVCIDGLWKIKQCPCDCREPRFERSRITVNLEPLPLPSDTRLQKHEHKTILACQKKKDRADADYWNSHPVKVAILDSGVIADTVCFPAITGASFIEDLTEDSHWHTITNPHGTIMASLVRKINPNCHIYAARTHHGPDMQGGDVNATINVSLNISGPDPSLTDFTSQALDWAMNQEADIICISWTCAKDLDEDDYTNLENKISDAGGKCLIFCATGDNGPSAEKSFPAAFPSPFSICSCSITGIPSANAEIENSEFFVPAEELFVEIPQYLNQGRNDSANDSSAATAVAAGLAALILSLARFAFHNEQDTAQGSGDDVPKPDDHDLEETVSRLKRRTMMERVFKYMCGGGSEKFVQPWNVFPAELKNERVDANKQRIAEFIRAAKGAKL